jgi:hypothetical protein
VADLDLRLAAHSCGGSHGLPQIQTHFIRFEIMRPQDRVCMTAFEQEVSVFPLSSPI